MLMGVGKKRSNLRSDEREKTVACTGKGLKLFGVRIQRQGESREVEEEDEGMRKSLSMGNLATCMGPERTSTGDHGYLSDGHLHSSTRKTSRMRKKGVPWTQEEHKTFLVGLKTLGKGDWRGISRNFVKTKTPTQVASHAQKYFLRQIMPRTKKRRSSLFDVHPNDAIPVGTKKQAAAQSLEGSTTLSLTCGRASNFHGLRYEEEISREETNQPMIRGSEAVTSISLAPTFRLCSSKDLIPSKIRNYDPCASDLPHQPFNLSPHLIPPSLPPLTETSNLELTIAPPQPLEAN